jgi:DNA mismatch repair protein MutS
MPVPLIAEPEEAAGPSEPFQSILFPGPDVPVAGTGAAETREVPAFFRDVNLDQIVDRVTKETREYDLAPFFYAGPLDLDTIAYRQEVMREVEDASVRQCLDTFALSMRAMRWRRAVAGQIEYPSERQRWHLGAVEAYGEGVRGLADALRPLRLRSRGMRRLRDYLTDYVARPTFRRLVVESSRLRDDLAAIRYCLRIKDLSITVLPYEGEPDYAAAVEAAFAKFRQDAVKDYRATLADAGRLNHVEARILERVAWLYPRGFAALDTFCTQHTEYVDATLARFDREAQFYIAYLTFIDTLRAAGLPFCYPRLSDTSREIDSRDAFDVALAATRVAEQAPVVRNDVALRDPERILVVSGPNQGGKTTFARMFAQVHYLASLGCPVPGTSARLFLFDRLFAHFERVEDVATLRGKLQDDLIRIHRILDEATPRSIVIMNEIFASTTLADAVFLGHQIMARLAERDLLAVCVTFLDDLASFNEKTVSIVSTVDRRDPTVRTFRLERRPADGLAYALAIAEKHRVTYGWLTKRLRP